ncbi:MAG: hypothetical protein Q9161_001815 [Pseudevernia consocians]
MPPFRGLSVQVITQDGPLKLHHDPDDDPSSEPRTRQRYIEAVTEATFSVKISMHTGFELHTLGLHDAVKITISYDDQKPSWHTHLTRAWIVYEWSKGKPAEYTFSRISHFCQETRQWKQGVTSFGALHMKSWQDPGKGRTSPLYPAIDANSSDETDTEAGDRSDGEDIERQGYCKYCSMLGCIPRTPSPEPETATPNSPVTSREQKVQNLRAQLALLEGTAGNVKAECSGSRATVKRELEDTENAGSRKRSRKYGPIETIDLTGD